MPAHLCYEFVEMSVEDMVFEGHFAVRFAIVLYHSLNQLYIFA